VSLPVPTRIVAATQNEAQQYAHDHEIYNYRFVTSSRELEGLRPEHMNVLFIEGWMRNPKASEIWSTYSHSVLITGFGPHGRFREAKR
jgi:hypothetical protein